jgi:hypothetical protein
MFNVCSSSRAVQSTFGETLEEITRAPKKKVAQQFQKYYFLDCPISHVPVVVCRSVGIRTRGRTAAKEEKPEHLSQEMRPFKAPFSLQP